MKRSREKGKKVEEGNREEGKREREGSRGEKKEKKGKRVEG